MRSTLPLVAREIGAHERTLRRAAARGMVRCRRATPRAMELASGERGYLRGHWPVLCGLTRALRTEPNVRLAVLYGSVARGDDHLDSDLDLLVSLRDNGATAALGLARRLERALGRPVDVARLDRVQAGAPLLLLQALDEGRVLVDRGGSWPALRGDRARVALAAGTALEADRRAATEALADLLEG